MLGTPTRTIVRSIRIDPDLWLWVVNRAASKKINTNAWLVRCIKAAQKGTLSDD